MPSAQAYVTATVTVWDDDPAIADERLRAGREDHPGPRLHLHARDRQRDRSLARQPARACLRQCPPAADLDPQPRPHDAVLGGVGRAGTGRASSTAPPLFFARTEGSTPFRFSLHVGDVGHTLVVGPTGAGKSVLLALMALQFRRYPRARRSSPSTSADRSGRPRSPWAATGTISAARSPATTRSTRRPAAARAHRRCRRARLGRRMGRGAARPRGRHRHAGPEGASLVCPRPRSPPRR